MGTARKAVPYYESARRKLRLGVGAKRPHGGIILSIPRAQRESLKSHMTKATKGTKS